MLKFKISRQTPSLIFWDVKIWFKPAATVRDYVKEIQKADPFQIGERPKKLIWIYSSGYVVGYVKLIDNESEFYNRKNLDIWDAQVQKCELVANSAEYLYRIWTKEEAEDKYERVRPIIPNMLLKAYAISE